MSRVVGFFESTMCICYEQFSLGPPYLICQACVPTHFLLGKRLHSPAFPVTATGLQLGFSAWAALNEAIETEATSRGRRNRFTSVQRHMRPDDLEDVAKDLATSFFV